MRNHQRTQSLIRTLASLVGLLLALTSLWFAPSTQAALLFYDGFNYPEGEVLGDTVSSPPWENAKSQFTIALGNLEHVGLEGSTGNRLNVASTSASLDGVRTGIGAWAAQSSGTLYCSFLLRLESINGIATTGNGTSVLTIGRTSNNSQMIGVNLLDSGGIKLGVLKYPGGSTPGSSVFFASGPGSNLSANGSTTYLIVAKYEWVDGTGNDVVTLWVNPDNVGATEDPGNKVSTSSGNDGTYPAGRLTLTRGPHLNLDEIRLGQTWSEVTPTGGPLVASQLGFESLQQVAFVDTTLGSVIVDVLNPGGVLVPTNGVPVTLSLTAGSGSLDGTLTRHTGPDGRAVFDDLSFDTVGSGKEITATSGTLTPATRVNLYVINDPNGTVATPPVITQTVATASSLILRGDSGSPNGEYQLLSAQVVSTPAASWTALTTNTFDAQGLFSSTNPLTLSEPHRFYRLLAQGAGSGMFQQSGYGSITGGGDTTDIVVVTNLTGFMAATAGLEPRVVYVDGTITLRTNGNTYLYGNKTIIGLGTNATLIGNLGIFLDEGSTIYNATNIIIRNLTITNPDKYGEDDAITIKNGGREVWIDHCTFFDCQDGLVDATREADFITVSWCRFYYTTPNGHENVNLIGGDDGDTSDTGKLHLTFHHNWYGNLAKERMPSVRYGRVHVFNNYFNSPGNNYCTRARLNSEVLAENNYYDSVQNPWELIITSGTTGLLRATGNITNNCTFTTAYAHNTGGTLVLVDGSDVLTAGDPLGLNPPPYAYTLDAAADVPNLVTNNAGAGKGPFAP